MIESMAVHFYRGVGRSERFVLNTIFKEKILFTSFETGPMDEVHLRPGRAALQEVSGKGPGYNINEVFIDTSIAVLVTVHNTLSKAAAGDLILFICRNSAVEICLSEALAIRQEARLRE